MRIQNVIFFKGRHTIRKCSKVWLKKYLASLLAFIRLQPQVALVEASFLKIGSSYDFATNF